MSHQHFYKSNKLFSCWQRFLKNYAFTITSSAELQKSIDMYQSKKQKSKLSLLSHTAGYPSAIRLYKSCLCICTLLILFVRGRLCTGCPPVTLVKMCLEVLTAIDLAKLPVYGTTTRHRHTLNSRYNTGGHVNYEAGCYWDKLWNILY